MRGHRSVKAGLGGGPHAESTGKYSKMMKKDNFFGSSNGGDYAESRGNNTKSPTTEI